MSVARLPLFSAACAAAPGAAAAFVDELDAGCFEGAPNDVKRRAAWLTYPGFKLVHGYDADARAPRELLLVPSKQSAGRPALTRRDHSGKVPKTADSHNSICSANPRLLRVPRALRYFIGGLLAAFFALKTKIRHNELVTY